MKKITRNGVAALTMAGVMLGAVASGASAQESSNRIATETDWSVFVDGTPPECWVVSAPKKTINTKDGKPVEVRRGDIRLFVTYRKGQSAGEVSFAGGYPFAKDSTVDLMVGDTKFALFTDGEGAWAGSGDEDAKIIAALKAGADVKVFGQSGRGTKTEDQFSLIGFTAASEQAAKRCQ